MVIVLALAMCQHTTSHKGICRLIYRCQHGMIVPTNEVALLDRSLGVSSFRAPFRSASSRCLAPLRTASGLLKAALPLLPLRFWLKANSKASRPRRARGDLLSCRVRLNGQGPAPAPEVTVTSWNILCSKLCNKDVFRHTNPKDLDNERRFQRVLEKLEQKVENEAILCLQEISQEWCGPLHAFFQQRHYYFVASAYGLDFEDYMGVAVAFPQKLYTLSDALIQCVADTLPLDHDAKEKLSAENPFRRSRMRRNRMICLKLRHQASNKEFVVSTYHMPCDYLNMKVMVIHASLCGACAFKFAGDLPLILAGDFNFRPGSAPYELLTTGKLQEENENHPGSLQGWHLWPQGCHLRSAYAEKHRQGEPFTNYAWNKDEEPFIGTLDYIFVSKHPEVMGVERLPTLGEGTAHLPNQYEPSDHLPVTAVLRPFGKAAIEPVRRPLAALSRPSEGGLSRRPVREETGSTVGRRFGSWTRQRLLQAE